MRLGRVLAGLLPREPEVHGLVALMELQASRFAARTGADGGPVLLPDQDRSRWDRTLIAHGLARAGPRRGPGQAARPVHRAGGHRRLPRPGAARSRTPTGRPSSRSTTRSAQLTPSPVV